MNWYKKAQQTIVLWHGSISRLAGLIKEQGVIKPNATIEQETGESQAGWNLSLKKDVGYGEGVYLSKVKNSAIYYASLRQEKEWQEIDINELYREEEYGYIGMFKVFINNKKLLIDIGGPEEYMYLGNISSQPNSHAWFEGPEWIDKTKELHDYRTKLENINKEFLSSENNDELV